MLRVVAHPETAVTGALFFCLYLAVIPYAPFLSLSLSAADHGALHERKKKKIKIEGYIMREGG